MTQQNSPVSNPKTSTGVDKTGTTGLLAAHVQLAAVATNNSKRARKLEKVLPAAPADAKGEPGGRPRRQLVGPLCPKSTEAGRLVTSRWPLTSRLPLLNTSPPRGLSFCLPLPVSFFLCIFHSLALFLFFILPFLFLFLSLLSLPRSLFFSPTAGRSGASENEVTLQWRVSRRTSECSSRNEDVQ